jgi:hypothetical protein
MDSRRRIRFTGRFDLRDDATLVEAMKVSAGSETAISTALFTHCRRTNARRCKMHELSRADTASYKLQDAFREPGNGSFSDWVLLRARRTCPSERRMG